MMEHSAANARYGPTHPAFLKRSTSLRSILHEIRIASYVRWGWRGSRGLGRGIATNSTGGSIRPGLMDGPNFWAFQSLDLISVVKHDTSRARDSAKLLRSPCRRFPVRFECEISRSLNILDMTDSLEILLPGDYIDDTESTASDACTTGLNLAIFNEDERSHLIGREGFVSRFQGMIAALISRAM